MNWMENRSWAAGQHGGGFLYRGCYFTYVVTDPQWLMAMGLAYNAAVALTLGPNIVADRRSAALEAWADLTRGSLSGAGLLVESGAEGSHSGLVRRS